MQQSLESARENMVKRQLMPQRITDGALLRALGSVPRELFLPVHLQGLAYVDEGIALGGGRYMLEPAILARLLQAAGVQKTDCVLDIECGTGYSSAILGQLAKKVISVDRDKRVAVEGAQLLDRLQIGNVLFVQQEDLSRGYPEKAPYQVILINGAVSAVSDKMKAQLADGGRLVTMAASGRRGSSGVLVIRHGNNFVTRALFDAEVPVLAGFEARQPFVF